MVRFLSPLIAATAIVVSAVLPASADIQTLSADSAHTLVQRGELILLDVRTPPNGP